jgi:hypothetical protein
VGLAGVCAPTVAEATPPIDRAESPASVPVLQEGEVPPPAPPTPAIVAAIERTGVSTTSPAFDYTYRLPALEGATPAMTAAFDKRVNAIVRAEEKSLVKAKKCKDKAGKNPTTGELTIVYHGAVYAGRYASITLLADRARPRCSNLDYTVPSSVTMDLKTGKTVKMASFVHDNASQFDSAVVASMRTKKQNPDCYKDSKLRRLRPPLNTPHAWNVTDAGVRVWYRGSADVGAKCAYLTGFVPWASVLNPADIRGKKTRTTYWGFNLKRSEGSRYGYTGRVAVVKTRGNQVVMFEWNLSTRIGTCYVGIRDGAKASMYEAGTAKGAKSVAMNNSSAKAVPKKYVSKGRKATKAEIKEIFTRAHGLNAKAIARTCNL